MFYQLQTNLLRSICNVFFLIIASALVNVLALAALTDQLPPTKLTAIEKSVMQRDPRIVELAKAVEVQIRTLHGDAGFPKPGYIHEFRTLHPSVRPAEESSFVIKAIEDSFSQEPKDWERLSVALQAAVLGIEDNDNKVTDICIKLVKSVKSLPDEALVALPSAFRIVALTGNKDSLQTLVDTCDPESLGMVASQEFQDTPRSDLIIHIVSAFYECLGKDEALWALRSLSLKYPYPKTPPQRPSFSWRVAQNVKPCLDQLEKQEP